jgi:RimJ/RimL family protein N-acetyltransferase
MERTPVIETDRLRMRGHRVADFADVYAMWRDPAVTRLIGPPSTETQAWMRLLGYIGHWEVLGYGSWLVDERATNHFLGELGFADFKRDIDPVMRGVPEAGWVFATHAHGQGYASEALAAALAWRDASLAVERTVCIINPLNLASIRVAERAGFHGIGEGNFNEHTVRFFERFRPPAAT